MNTELRKVLLEVADWLDTTLWQSTTYAACVGPMAAAEVALRMVAAGLVEEEH
jgi:hypothetical protein